MNKEVKELLTYISEDMDGVSSTKKSTAQFLINNSDQCTIEALTKLANDALTDFLHNAGYPEYELQGLIEEALKSLYTEEEMKIAMEELAKIAAKMDEIAKEGQALADRFGLTFEPKFGDMWYSHGAWVNSSSYC